MVGRLGGAATIGLLPRFHTMTPILLVISVSPFSNSLGLLAPIVAGYIVSYTGRFDIAWYMCAAALVMAGLASILMVDRPITMRSGDMRRDA